jgi:hypothetical protein
LSTAILSPRPAPESCRPSPFAIRLLIAVACVYGPFLLAPFAALVTGCEPCRETWFAGFAILPGRFPAAVLTDALGASPIWTTAPFAVGLIAVWVLLTAWCARECRSVQAYSAALSGAFAIVAVLAYAL